MRAVSLSEASPCQPAYYQHCPYDQYLPPDGSSITQCSEPDESGPRLLSPRSSLSAASPDDHDPAPAMRPQDSTQPPPWWLQDKAGMVLKSLDKAADEDSQEPEWRVRRSGEPRRVPPTAVRDKNWSWRAQCDAMDAAAAAELHQSQPPCVVHSPAAVHTRVVILRRVPSDATRHVVVITD
eukprot:TRINITY_DN17215_c0_g1_i1.p2 TRINITY_DN17215_c0_g1~~TRINITY_DN17215_c0_g1_i1.p2  ORF type:complete len:181 (+),score=45.62 TRINITY_DN17215_c0_g1_i1:94-636(+)